MDKYCLICGGKIFKRGTESKKILKSRKFCSSKCSSFSRRGKKPYNAKYKVVPCFICGKEVKVSPSNKSKNSYCSTRCSLIGRKTGEYVKCPICGKSKWKIQYHLKRGGKYCSIDCYNKDKKGKSGRKKGFLVSEETRKKQSLAQIKRFDRDGRSNLYFSYRNLLLRRSLKYKLWRQAVFERDKYTCQGCGKKGKDLEADHKEGFAKLLHKYNPKSLFEAYQCDELWNVENGETLCHDCHKETLNYRGKGYGPYKNYHFMNKQVILQEPNE